VSAELTIYARNGVPSLAAVDVQRAAELRRVKTLADAVLAGSLVVLLFARTVIGWHPAFGFVAAFAEAAAIGGLADWYAVVALFRHPLGLPIPHTAIIPSNQRRIGERLGEFIELHFLDPVAVRAKLNQTDFASFIANWLTDRTRSARLASLLQRLLPGILGVAESSGLTSLVVRRIQKELNSIDLAPIAAGALRSFISEGHHQRLLEDLMAYVNEVLNKPDTLAAMRERIRTELPILLRLYQVDVFLLKRIAASATAFFEDVRIDTNHPVRSEFDRLAVSLIERLEGEPAFAARLAAVQHEVLSRPELGGLVAVLWSKVKDFVDGATGKTVTLERLLAALLTEIGGQLAADTAMRDQINRAMVNIASSMIAEHKTGISSFIADQVKAWDTGQLVNLIENNVGKDLQYIRFNGALIGGLAGLFLYSAEALLRSAETFLRLV
jgi:uncharacterized membrane-anchored protein YjiN (DUF445 family)